MSTPFVLEIYTESTPNPESQKFVTNIHLLPNYVAEYRSKESATESLLAQELFDIPFVSGVFISNNFVTITKKPDYEWYEISPELKEVIKKFINSGRPVEGDGGHIAFRSFENGVVNLSLQGSCSGCPSSSITLKSGIEGLLKRMVPEVKEVVAVEE